MIRSVAVLGAGVMGAQIAAHFANAGVPALLLDVTAEAAEQGLKRARGAEAGSVLHAGHLEAHHDRELRRRPAAPQGRRLDPRGRRRAARRQARAAGDASTRPDGRASIVSSNTSGIPIAAIAEGRSDDFRRHWLGTHFFNPPRYLHLLEVIPTAETSPAVVDAVTAFADHHLGKGVVVAKDSPNFIGNHLALYGVARILADVDARRLHDRGDRRDHRPAIGRPKSATFRTLDLAGLDILVHVIRQPARAAADDRRTRRVRRCRRSSSRCSRAGLTGEKAGQGFYKRVKGAAANPRS